MNMNTTSSIRIHHADTIPRVQPASQKRLTQRVNQETLCEMILITVTFGLMTFLSYICYHALQNYGAM